MKTARPRTRTQLLEHLAEQTRIAHDPETPFEEIEDALAEIRATLVRLSFRRRRNPAAYFAGLVMGWLLVALIITGLFAGVIAIARAVS